MEDRSALLLELSESVARVCQSADTEKRSATGWNPTTILGHLGDVDEQVWVIRIHLMLEAFRAQGNPPTFSWWEPDPIVTEQKYSKFTLNETKSRLISSRSEIVRVLTQLKDEEWQASALHGTFGEINIEKLIQEVLKHDQEHRQSLY